MKALHRKLLRDLRLMWSQALTIALVVASGIAGFVTSLSAVESLAAARDQYYSEGRFADVFASLKRAPESVLHAVRGLSGVAAAQGTVEYFARVEMEGVVDPIIGQLIGVDPRTPAQMNLVTLSRGRLLGGAGLRADSALEAVVSEGFARARGLQPGARLSAVINGKRRQLVIVGTGLSPEFVFAGLWGMPDLSTSGVFWVDREALAAAYGMTGAFNRLAIRLAPGAQEPAVKAAVTRLVAPYGGREVIGRDSQMSHAMLDNEIKEQRVLGTVLPVIFLGVAAFLLNVVVTRLVSTQREQIAALKALGYGNAPIAAHYLQFVLLIALSGLALGVFTGDRLGGMLTGLYAEFFYFPRFEHRIAPWLLLASALVTVATAVVGTLTAILRAVRLPPAEAMRPPAPAQYRRTVLERLGVQRMPPALRSIVRNIERRPLRVGLAVAGVAAAVAITVMGNFFRDAIEYVVDAQFNLGLRSDVAVWVNESIDDSARLELARLPGVTMVESTRFVPVRLVNGHRSERVDLRGYHGRAQLYRVIDGEGRQTQLEGRGLVLTDRLAGKLGVRPGDTVLTEVLEGDRRTVRLPVGATVPEMMGLNAYMDRRALNQALGDGDLSNGFVLLVERGREPALLEATKQIPRVAGAFSKAAMLRGMQEISARNVRIMSTVLTVVAAVIAVGVVYNNARISLAERGWELASLRVLGFTRAEVSALLLGEFAIVIAAALPLGMALGYGLTHAVAVLLVSDQFRFPVVILPRTYALAALCVLVAAVASALVVRRRVDRLDMVAVLKTRE
jgi:putative ABC transport system permease protein